MGHLHVISPSGSSHISSKGLGLENLRYDSLKFCDQWEGVGGQREPAGGEITKTLPRSSLSW